MTHSVPPDLTCDDVREMAGAFVLGALTEPEAAAVRAHLATCADAHLEIAELGSVVPILAESVPVVEPPASLKARVLAAAAADGLAAAAAKPDSTNMVDSIPIPLPVPDRPAVGRSRQSTVGWVLRIAAVLAIVALTGWNLLLQGQLTDAHRYEQDVAAVLEAAQQPGSVAAILAPDGGTGSGIAAVTEAGVLSMVMHNLAATSGGQVYEAWAIASDQVAVPLGSFQVGRSGVATFAGSGLPAESGIVLALTLEPGPGATTPTAPIISKGVASSAG
jgi:anti-sigma-K factor RskA